jgi:hypothetical protein
MACWGPSPWGVRRLLSHVNNLPRDSAYSRALRGARAFWDEQVELTAQLIDAVNVQSYYLLKVNGQDSARQPEPVTRPGVENKTPVSSLSDFAAWIKNGA